MALNGDTLPDQWISITRIFLQTVRLETLTGEPAAQSSRTPPVTRNALCLLTPSLKLKLVVHRRFNPVMQLLCDPKEATLSPGSYGTA